MGVETRGRTQDGNGDGSGDGNASSSGDGDGDGDEDGNGDGNEDGVGEGGRETEKREKPYKSYRRHMVNGGDLGGIRKKHKQERVDSVAFNLNNLENSKEAGGGVQGTPSLNNSISRESVSPLSCLIRGFRNSYH